MPRLSMHFLGSYQLLLDQEPVTTLEYDKVRALLAYLAMEADRPHRREALVGLLWPELTERRARRNLSQALLTLRRALGDEGPAPFLVVTPHAIQFDAASEAWVDVSAFTSLLARCRAHPHWRLETCSSCGDLLARASALYAGSFLAGLSLPDSPAFEEWQLLWRERLHHEATDALSALARGCDHRGERDAALRYARQWVAMDPWHEDAHRQLMRALALHGRRTEALAQYEACRRTLQEELGVGPARETTALYEAIRGAIDLTGLGYLSGLGSTPPHNLPAPATPFVGREELLNGLRGLLRDPDCRLVTLVGPGGSGKTRLALQMGAEVVAAASERYPDGVYFVPLSTLRARDSIAPSIAQAVGVGPAPGQDPAGQLLRALRRKHLLLILDNYEQLLGGVDRGLGPGASPLCGAAAVAEILDAAPGVQILVTSRVRLNVLAEHVLPVGGMAFPRIQPADPEEVQRHSAVALFLDRARALRPTFAPDDGALGHVGRICRLVEGMPLAILLAAAWIDVLSPREIADRVAANLDLLEADLGDLPARQRSMRAVFDASWATLTGEARSAFAHMSVFRGGFTDEAARSVAGAGLRILRELVRTSFLQRPEDGRFEIHELLQQYGAEQLARRPAEQEETLDHHCTFYGAFYARRALKVWNEGLGSVAPEVGNIQAAWHRALECGHVSQVRTFVGELNGGLHQLYYSLGWMADGEETFARAVAVLRAAEPSRENEIALALALRYHALFASELGCRQARPRLIRESVGILSRLGVMEELVLSRIYEVLYLDDPSEVDRERLLCEALAMARECGCTFGVGWASNLLGNLAMYRQAYPEGEKHLRVALKVFHDLGHHRGLSWVVASLAQLAYFRADYASARALAAESMAMCERIGWTWRVVDQLLFLGEVALAERAQADASAYYQEALVQAQDIGDDRLSAYACCGLGDAVLARHDLEAAQAAYRQAFDLAPDDLQEELECRVMLGLVAWALGERRLEHAATLVALARRIMSKPLPPAWEAVSWMDLRLKASELYAELQGQLSPAAFTGAEKRAQSMSLHATVLELLEDLQE
jgi:DNA-binding SARP family transcriptional activator/predicted ATPase